LYDDVKGVKWVIVVPGVRALVLFFFCGRFFLFFIFDGLLACFACPRGDGMAGVLLRLVDVQILLLV